MSAIAGLISFDDHVPPEQHLRMMTAAMAYRGPDGINHWIKGNVALGHCLLQTTPESLEECQPLGDEDGSLTLVLDGRIDNRKSLRRELIAKGKLLRDASDAELVLRAYECWSSDCVTRLDGDFAFVIWDARRHRAFLARDRMGKKPLYYWRAGNTLAFATDFKALLSLPGSPREVNEAMVAEHLAVDVRSLDETLIRGIMRLPPACFQRVDRAGHKTSRYWDVDCAAEIRYKDESEYAEHFLDLLRNTVRRQMRSVSPVGIYLSGGVDSSTIAAIAADVAPGNQKPEAFSVVYPGEDYDEKPYIDSVLSMHKLRGHFVEPQARSFSDFGKDIARHLDLTDGPNGADTRQLRQIAKARNIRVMLDGYGGDEWFGRGRHYYNYLMKKRDFRRVYAQLLMDRKSGRDLRELMKELLGGGVGPMLPGFVRGPLKALWLHMRRGQEHSPAYGLVAPTMAAELGLSQRLSPQVACRLTSQLDHQARHQILHYGWNVRGKEINSTLEATYELEERSPFDDHKMVEFAFGLPEEQRSGGLGKHVIRRAMQGLIPEMVRTRTDKAEFTSLVASAVRSGPVHESLAHSHLISQGIVDEQSARQISEAFCRSCDLGLEGVSGVEWQLWMFMILEEWVSTLRVDSRV